MREASQQAAPAPEQEDQQQKQKSEGAQNEPGAPKPGAAKQDSQKKPGATGALEAAEASDQKAGPRQPVDVVAAQILDKERREQDALKRYLRTLRGRAGKPKAGDKDW
jgi:hypothetical protein